MIKKTVLVLLLVLVALVAYVGWQEYQGRRNIMSVSIFDLLVHPQKHFNEKKYVFGYLRAKTDVRLYSSEDHGRFDYTLLGVGVFLDDYDLEQMVRERCSDTWVVVKGDVVFRGGSPAFTNIDFIDRLEPSGSHFSCFDRNEDAE